jgi:alkylation response protein AidB-like acyl-CoA dehydrogenase
MNFDLSEDQMMLSETVASFAKQASPVSRFRKLRGGARGFERETWKKMGELGWLAVGFPEACGGFGGTFVDLAVILEKLGTTLVPEPFLSSVVLAGSTVLFGGSEEQRTRLLGPMIAGDTTLAFAYAERGGRYDPLPQATRAVDAGGRWSISGEKVFVLDGDEADTVIVSAATARGPSIFAVERAAIRVTPIRLVDGRRGANMTFDGAKAELLGEPGAAGPVIERVMDRGAAAACAEGVGIAKAVLDMTIAHMNLREQFGVKIGTFQVLQHAAVDMFVELEMLRSMAMTASVKVDSADERERSREVSAAKVQLATGGKRITQQAIQIHGGIGITDEHDVGLYFKRMHALNALFGDDTFHVARFAALSE